VNRLLFVASAVLVCGAVIAALMVVGGPGFARMEKNDSKRAQDLRRLGEYYRCNLPVDLAFGDSDPQINPERCHGHRRKPDARDPATDAEYRFTRSGPDSFEVCATFETDSQNTQQYPYQMITFEGKNGCLTYTRNAAGMDWVTN